MAQAWRCGSLTDCGQKVAPCEFLTAGTVVVPLSDSVTVIPLSDTVTVHGQDTVS